MTNSTLPALTRSGARVAPLSFAQERLWFIDATTPGSVTYNVPMLMNWRGRADPEALRAALTAVVAKHEILRTTYQVRNGQPVQVVGDLKDAGVAEVEVIELDGVADAGQRIRAEAGERAAKPFDLAAGPLLRCTVWRGAPSGDALLLVIHHIAVDGWSIAVLLEDLGKAYQDAIEGRPASLPGLDVQYADFAVWDRAAGADPELRQRVADRAADLLTVPGGVNLTGRRARTGSPEGAVPGAQHTFTVPGPVVADLRELAKTLRATPYVLLFAAFQLVLRRWSGQPEFLVGTLAANRPHPDLEKLAGFFVNTVPLKCRSEVDWTFAELCGQTRKEAFRSLTYQRIPFNQLTAEVAAAKGARVGLVDVGFALQNVPAPKPPAPQLWTPPVQLPTGTAKFDLLLLLEEAQDEITGMVEFATDRHPGGMGRFVGDDFLAVLTKAVAEPGSTVRDLLAGIDDVDDRLAGWEPDPEDVEEEPDWPPAEVWRGEFTEEQRWAADLFVNVLPKVAKGDVTLTVADLVPETNFFSLSGHSLLAVHMLSEAQRRHGIWVPPADFLADPTVAGLGRLLAAGAEAPAGKSGGTAPDPADRYPATSVQQRFWFLDRIAGLRSAYVLPMVIELRGAIDQDALRRALQQVLGRHPALRSRFELDRKLRRLFYRTDSPPPEVMVSDGERWDDARLEARLAKVSWDGFDLATGPLARAVVITRKDRTLVVVSAHHIVNDGWSQQILSEQLAEAYRAEWEGRPAELPASVHPSQVDGSNSSAAASREERAAARVSELDGAPTDVLLPYDRQRTNTQPTLGASRRVKLGEELTARLREVCGELGCTTFMATAALLASTLGGRSGQRDFLFAIPWVGRDAPESANAVGMFVNTLVLRVDSSGEPTWRELLGRVREASVSCYRNADVPFDAIASAVHPDRGLDRPPVTPVYLASADGVPTPAELSPGIEARYLPLRPLHVKYEFELTVTELADDLLLSASYLTDLFDEDTITDLLAALVTKAMNLTADPDAKANKGN